MKTVSELKSIRNLHNVETINKIMSLGFTRDQAGTLLTIAVYPTIRFHDPKFIDLSMRMFKDTRVNKWADETDLGNELKTLCGF